MTWIPDELQKVADEVRNGQIVSYSLREVLGWFGAQRRGRTIVWMIERALKETELITEPNFEYAYLDGEIQFLTLSQESQEKAVQTAEADKVVPQLVTSA